MGCNLLFVDGLDGGGAYVSDSMGLWAFCLITT